MKGRTRVIPRTASREPRCAVSITETPRSLLPAGIAVYSIPTDRIVSPEGSLHTSPPESIAALAGSIHKYGIIHPLTVKALPDGTIPVKELLRQIEQCCPHGTITLELMEAKTSIRWMMEGTIWNF